MKKILALTIALMLLTTVAFAADPDTATQTVSISIIAGELEIALTTPMAFADKTLTGADQTATTADATAAAPVITLSDKTGDGLGWNVTVALPALSNGTQTLDAKYYQDTDALLAEVSSSAGMDTTGLDVKVSAGVVMAGGVVLDAAAASGMGTYVYTPDGDGTNECFEIDLPAETYAGEYTNTFTVSIQQP